MNKPILTVCPESYPGTTSVLKHYNVTNLVEHSSEIAPEVVKNKQLVILGGWTDIYYEALQKIKTTGVKTAIYWTSSVGQTDFSNFGVEVSFLHLIKDMVMGGLADYVLCATPSVYDMWTKILPEEKVRHIPYAFDWEDTQQYLVDDIPVGENWVDVFCPGDTRKNILVQTHGAADAGAHIYFSGMRPKYKYFADLINAKYTDMGWMSKPFPYYRVIQTMKLGMQVTYAETFDYVVAEHFAMKRPCLISTVMGQWVDKSLWKDLMVYNMDDPLEVADCVKNIISMDEKEWKSLNNRCHKVMEMESIKRNNKVSKGFQDLLKEC